MRIALCFHLEPSTSLIHSSIFAIDRYFVPFPGNASVYCIVLLWRWRNKYEHGRGIINVVIVEIEACLKGIWLAQQLPFHVMWLDYMQFEGVYIQINDCQPKLILSSSIARLFIAKMTLSHTYGRYEKPDFFSEGPKTLMISTLSYSNQK